MDQHEKYMHRCIGLARKGAGYTAPNPMVGAVLVQDDRIIGEGWHQRYGEAHAEVNAIAMGLAAQSGLTTSGLIAYVSLEPCAHHGKTPPCADLIIRTGIPKVVIGCRDPFEAVNGKGIEKLRAAGVEVIEGVLADECRELNKRFFTFHEKKRPYVILKWAQTADGFIARSRANEGISGDRQGERLLISNEYSNRLVHRWRSEESAILVGTNTALQDDPALTNRLWPGPSPLRLVVDMDLRLPPSLQLFNGAQRTIVFNAIKEEEKQNLVYYRLEKNKSLISQLLPALHQMNIQSVLVEGGARLLQSFIDAGLWDEARVIRNKAMKTGRGLAAPVLESGLLVETMQLEQDEIQTWRKPIEKTKNELDWIE